MIDFADLRAGPDGLVPAVVRDETTGRVGMLAYMDAEALERTQATGLAHFHSRSRDTLWKKGETSGNTLSVTSITTDCDDDALLLDVVPAGPICHTGAATCFDSAADDRPTLGLIVDRLSRIIADRADSDLSESYTARLIADPDLAARKVLEEAGEVAFAVKDLPAAPPDRVVEEAADVVYHLLALLAAAGVDPNAVATELRRRMR